MWRRAGIDSAGLSGGTPRDYSRHPDYCTNSPSRGGDWISRGLEQQSSLTCSRTSLRYARKDAGKQDPDFVAETLERVAEMRQVVTNRDPLGV